MSGADEIIIRLAEPRDSVTLGKLGGALMRLHYAFNERRFLEAGPQADEGYAEFLRAQLNAPGTAIFVAERMEPREVVGYAYAAVEPLSWKELRDEAGFIHDLLVSDAARDAGVGRRLMDACVDWLQIRGVARVILWTAAENAGARRFFERHGFQETMLEMTLELDNRPR